MTPCSESMYKSLTDCFIDFDDETMLFQCALLLLCQVALISSNALLELRLLSTESQEVSVSFHSATSFDPLLFVTTEVSNGSKVHKYRLKASLSEKYMVTIGAAGGKEFGIKGTVVRMQLPAQRLTVVPEKVMPPLKGLLIMLQCDSNWHGERCDVFCDELVAKINNRRCHSTGVLRCPNGLMGSNCTDLIKPPYCGCKFGGACHYTFTSSDGELVCACPEGRGGKKCEEVVEVPIRLSTYSTFLDPIPTNMTVDGYYASKMIKNRIGKKLGRTHL